jgi:putative membrane protein
MLIVLLPGCRHENTAQQASNDTASTATNARDTASTVSPTDTGTTSTSSTGSTGGSASTLTAEEKTFVVKTAGGGVAEVKAATDAAQRAVSADVKAFANRMIEDHGKANDELRQLATNKGIALETTAGGAQQQAATALASKSGTDFDRAYMNQMIRDHEGVVADFERMAKAAKDPDLRQWIAGTLPVVKDHLKMAKEIAAKLK